MRRRFPLFVIPFAMLLVLSLLSQNETPVAGTAALGSEAAPVGAAGMRLYVDPDTREFVEAPSEPIIIEMAQDGLSPYSTSSEGLVEVDAPGGGKMVDLRGRFRMAYTATVDESGVVHAGCGHSHTTESERTDSGKEGE